MSVVLFHTTEIAQRRLNRNNSQNSETDLLSSDSDSQILSAPITDDERSTEHEPCCMGANGEKSDFDAMKSTFESFVLKLEETFLRLKIKDYADGIAEDPLRKGYKEICKRLRLEVLLALDKLELYSATEHFTDDEVAEFTRKMHNLKSQLNDIRRECHGAVREMRLQKYMLNNGLTGAISRLLTKQSV